MSIHKPEDRRNRFSGDINRRIRDASRDPHTQIKEIWDCRIKEVYGPSDSKEADLHLWALVELPAGKMLREVKVKLNSTIDEIYTLHGNVSNLIGKYCKITYTGELNSQTHGVGYLVSKQDIQYDDSEAMIQTFALNILSGSPVRNAKEIVNHLIRGTNVKTS